jgi:hypothetical protein
MQEPLGGAAGQRREDLVDIGAGEVDAALQCERSRQADPRQEEVDRVAPLEDVVSQLQPPPGLEHALPVVPVVEQEACDAAPRILGRSISWRASVTRTAGPG